MLSSFRMSFNQFAALAMPQRRAEARPVREKRERKLLRSYIVHVPLIVATARGPLARIKAVDVKAFTASEARAFAKTRLGWPRKTRLPVGTIVERTK